jgi:hypothetical protein
VNGSRRIDTSEGSCASRARHQVARLHNEGKLRG